MTVSSPHSKQQKKTKSPAKIVGKIRIDNKLSIIKAAEYEFAKNGYDRTTMANIADRAKLARTSVHYYFNSKLELYNCILVNLVELWMDTLDQATPEDDPAEVLGGYIEAKVAQAQSNPLATKIFASEIIHGAKYIGAYLNSGSYDWTRDRASVISTWIEQGKMDPIDPFCLLYLIWGSTQYYVESEITVKKTLRKKRLSNSDFNLISDNLTYIILKGCGIKTNRKLPTQGLLKPVE